MEDWYKLAPMGVLSGAYLLGGVTDGATDLNQSTAGSRKHAARLFINKQVHCNLWYECSLIFVNDMPADAGFKLSKRL